MDKLPPDQRSSFTRNPFRLTKREVPAQIGSKLQIVAGWNGEVDSYYFIVTWTEDAGESIKAGDIYHEGGYPWNHITDIATLCEHLIGELDLTSPVLTVVLYELMADRVSDLAAQHYFENPYRNDHLLTLTAKVLDQDFTPVIEPSQVRPRERGRYWNGTDGA